MNSITIADLAVFNGEPRIQDLRVAEALDYAQPRDIRKLIQRKLPELERHGEVFATMAKTSSEIDGNRATVARFSGKRGPVGNEYLLNMAQALLIAMFSDTPKAAEARKTLIDVFLAFYRGETNLRPRLEDQAGLPFDITAEGARAIELKLALVNIVGRFFGHERARETYRQIGLPLPPEPQVGGQSEARDCLWTLLNSQHHGVRLISLLEQAMNEEAGANDALRRLGLHAEPDDDGYIVSNVSKVLDTVYEGTKWHNGHWKHALRRLPGARLAPRRTYAIGHNARGTFLPAKTLDILAEPEQPENPKASREA
jgi:hypothetical protein